MGTLKGLIERAKSQVGYCEKASNKDLDSFTGNAGDSNYTKFSRDVNNVGLSGCQAQPWCCTFAFWQELQEYGKDIALKHWNMTEKTYCGYNCFSTYNVFKKVGKVGMTPKLGAVVIFNFSHAGRVINTYSKSGVQYFSCLEGNTGAGTTNRNGGETKIKERRFDDPTVKGFCYIDYDVIEPPIEIKSGWVKESNSWKFYLDNDRCIKNDWYLYNSKWCWFDESGSAIHDTWLEYKGNWYCFDSDCYMKSSEWTFYNDKWYYLKSDGIMAKNAYVKSQEPNNKNYYYLNENGEFDESKTVQLATGDIVI